ncbi:MAG TPA: SIR2 family protein [Nitrososphaeraceae archaeon]|nr:SIR2 family protein [Nitrososphaeraceae archaeon]
MVDRDKPRVEQLPLSQSCREIIHLYDNLDMTKENEQEKFWNKLKELCRLADKTKASSGYYIYIAELVKSLNNYKITIETLKSQIEDAKDLGQESLALNLAIMRNYKNSIDKIEQLQEKCLEVENKLVIKEDEPRGTEPTKLDREREATWSDLLYSIKEKICIPLIGQEANLQWLNELKDLSFNWAKECQYPLENFDDLSSVSNFLAMENGNNLTPKNELSRIISKIEPPDFSQAEYDNTPYSVLAKLPLPIYITTNYDHFIEAALINNRRKPVSDFCRWSDHLLKNDVYANLSKNFSKSFFSIKGENLSSVLEQGSDYEPTVERPLVYHLYGDIAAPASMVLTEKDHFEFVTNLNKNYEKTLLNSFIYPKITSAPLLLIGYTLNNLFLCLLLKSISEKSDLSNNIIVFPSISVIQKKRAEEYSTKYYKDIFNANTFWMDNYEFSKELQSRWNKFKSEL